MLLNQKECFYCLCLYHLHGNANEEPWNLPDRQQIQH